MLLRRIPADLPSGPAAEQLSVTFTSRPSLRQAHSAEEVLLFTFYKGKSEYSTDSLLRLQTVRFFVFLYFSAAVCYNGKNG